jgi:molybdenum cofactor cytidylyltransferase
MVIDKLAAIILAAGSSSRMGSDKALLDFKNKTFLEHICYELKTAGIKEVLVVVNPNWTQSLKLKFCSLKKKCQILSFESLKLKWVVNPHPEEGQLSSFLRGIEHLAPEIKAVMLCLVDHPAIKAATYKKLAQTWERNTGKIIVPVYQGERGHPVIFDVRFFPQLRAIPAGQGARYVVYNNEELIIEVPVNDAGVRKDIDTLGDYKKLRAER